MFLKSTSSIPSFLAGDKTLLRELLHPKNDGLDLPFSIAHASLAPQTASLAHRLQQDEWYYFLSGEGRLHCDDEVAEVKAGDLALIPAQSLQHVENTGSEAIIFLCIVCPAWTEEGEEIV